jgi:Cu(I)/Ag(I) efflux system membrane fusion protein
MKMIAETISRAWNQRLARAFAGGALPALLLLAAACGGAQRPSGEPLHTGRSGGLSWNLWLRPDPPQQKGNAVWVEVLGADGKPAQDAAVTLVWDMPAMGSMPEMRGDAAVSREGEGLFRVAFDLPMTGTWKLELALSTPASRATAEYSLTVGAPGLRDLGTSGGEPAAAAGREAPAESAVVRIDAARRQEIGVTTGVVRRQPLAVPVRAVGKVVFDETALSDVTVKYRGFVGRLYVDRPGQLVRRGQPLFTLYSPELFAAQQEYLIALGSQREAQGTGAPDRADYLVTAARQRLLLWDLQPGQIDRLARAGKPLEEIPILSPAGGYVVEKNVVAGAAVEPGMKLFRLAGLDTVWVEAEVYESELPLLRAGDRAVVRFPYLPGRSFAGRIAFVYPYLDGASRTGRVRIQLANPAHALKPDMFADVTLTRSLGDRLAVPEEAVLYAGDKSFVFVDLGEGRLAPRRVTLGQTAGDRIEVLAGLREGETIVTSGNFLVAAESRLKVALEQWR